MKEWKEVKLGDVAIINPREAIGRGTIARKIGMDNLDPFKRKPNGFTFEEYKGGIKFRNKDTIMARITPSLENGKTGYILNLEDDEIAYGSTEYIVFREKKDVTDSLYIYYLVCSNTVRDIAIASMTGSSGRQRVQTDVILDLNILLPPLPEQKAIAQVLSSFDDKIELLNEQNKTLEQMAETLFRQWFVEEAEEDWEEKPLSDFGEIVCGKTPPKKRMDYFGGDIPFIKIPDMHNKTFVIETTDSLTIHGKNSQKNKTLPSSSIMVSCIATVGLVSMNLKEAQTNQQINSIIPSKEIYRYFLFCFLRQSYDLLKVLASGGTATLNLNTGNFSKIIVKYSSETQIESFSKKVTPYFEKIKSNQLQIQTLTSLRDTLLPKLMSGEVRVVMS